MSLPQDDPFMQEYDDIGPINTLQGQIGVFLQEIEARIPETPSVKLNGTTPKRADTELRFSSIDEIMSMPEIEYAVHELLEMSTISMVVGESEAGKTFVMLGMALAIASGRRWLGRETKKGHVVYVYAEGKRGLRKRLLAWKTHFNAELPTEHFHAIPKAIDLKYTKQALIELIKTLPEPPVLVVFDTFSQISPGVNENDAKDVASVLRAARDIKDEFECHIAIIHHSPKNNNGSGYRGSSAFLNNTDAMIEISREEQGASTIHSKRTKDDGHFDDLYVNLEVVKYGTNEHTGEPLTSCVLVSAEPTEKKPVRASQNEEKMLNALRVYGGKDGLASSEWERHCTLVYNFTHSIFTKALRGLKKKNLVKLDGEGTGAKYQLVL
jgi:hypothetical protein